jgi:hypothetical protein
VKCAFEFIHYFFKMNLLLYALAWKPARREKHLRKKGEICFQCVTVC